MDLRTKLVFALVSVSLVSMFSLAFLTYGPARDLWRDSTLDALDALAESKKSDIEGVVEGWRDRVRLIASRTRLRRITQSFDTSHSAADRAGLDRILRDAQSAVRRSEVLEITVFDTHQDPIGTTIAEGFGAVEPLLPADLPDDGEVRLLGLSSGTAGVEMAEGATIRSIDPNAEVAFIATVTVDGTVVGAVRVRMSADALLDVTRNYTGLGMTGETLLATRDGPRIDFIGPPRHDMPFGPPTMDDIDDPIVHALEGHDVTLFRDAVDYRGEEVWAATRYVPDLDAGLVVKFDRTEREAPLEALRSTTVRLAVALSAFAILVAVVIGLHFASPIHQLAEVAEEIYAGNFRVRAPVRGEDEIGRLAYLFNRMTDRILESNRDLRQRIKEGEGPTDHEHEGKVTGEVGPEAW